MRARARVRDARIVTIARAFNALVEPIGEIRRERIAEGGEARIGGALGAHPFTTARPYSRAASSSQVQA